MNENLILIAKNKIKDQSLTSLDAQKHIEKIGDDNSYMIEWCFSMLHQFTTLESRAFALETIQRIINRCFDAISIDSIDHMINEFFFSIYKDSNYSEVSLLNLISGIQARLINILYPIEWPVAFDPEEEFSVMNFPDIIFFKFLKSLGPIAQTNSKLVKLMIEDGYSLNNLLNRISKSIIEGSLIAKKSYIDCFEWIDFHILINLPCFPFILDDLCKVPNPTTAESILSTIFKQDKFTKKEKIQFITDFNLFDRFMQYLNTFSTIDEENFYDFTNLICQIFEPLTKKKFISSIVPLFITTLNRLLQMKNRQRNDFKRLNDLFHSMIENEIISFSFIRDIYYPIFKTLLSYPEAESGSNISLLIDLFFSDAIVKQVLKTEIQSFFLDIMQTVIKTDDNSTELTNFQKSYILISNVLISAHNTQKYPTKIIVRQTLIFFLNLLELEPSQELLNDPYYIKALKAFSDLFVQSSIYLESKSFDNIKSQDSKLFYREFQWTVYGLSIFMDSMLSLAELSKSNIISLQNINDIIIFFISSLNDNLLKIASKLIEKAPDEVISGIKAKSTEIILERDPTSLDISEIHLLFKLFGPNKNEELGRIGPKSFLTISPDDHSFDFFSRIYLNNVDTNGNLVPSGIFSSNEDYFEYGITMAYLFGYRSFPFYFNEIFNNVKRQNISAIKSIISILSMKYKPPNIASIQLTFEIVQTNGFIVNYSQDLLRNLFNIIDRDTKENTSEEASKDLIDFSSFYSEFVKYIIYFTPIAPAQIYSQILSIIEHLFKCPILSNDALEYFFKFAVSKNDFGLLELIYPSSVKLLIQLLSKPDIFPVNFKQCIIVILTFHHKIFHKNEEWGYSIISPSNEILSTTDLSFYRYVHLMESNDDQFSTELGKISNQFFGS